MREFQFTRCAKCINAKTGSVIGGKISKTCNHPDGRGLRGYLEDDSGCIYGTPKDGCENDHYVSTLDATKLPLDIFLDSYFGRHLKFRLADSMESVVQKRICYLRPSVKYADVEEIMNPKHKWNKYLNLRVQCVLQKDNEYPDCVVLMLYVPEGY